MAAWMQPPVECTATLSKSHVLLATLTMKVLPVGQRQVFPVLFKAAEGLVSGIQM